ncbi:MAG: hypothetical protein ABL989_10860 [Gammaproteobacteria bacterium]
MSRSALVVAAALFALGALVWLLTTGGDAPTPAPVQAVTPAGTSAPAPATNAAPPAPPASTPRAAPGQPARITTREEFIQALKARGLDGEKALAAYRDWRVAKGFLGADPLTGVTAENAPSQVYAAMDRPTQKALADSGDMGAMQAYAAGSLPGDPFTAVEYYGRASRLGSAAAMGEIAGILADIGGMELGDVMNDRPFADKLLDLRGGDPDRDLRQDAAAWTLAAIRLHGPIVATAGNLELVEGLGRSPDKAFLAGICGKSLAILADLSTSSAVRDGGSLPPAFPAEKNLYDRLPCRDTPAPVMPPRALERCTPSPATGSANQPVELWICEGN